MSLPYLDALDEAISFDDPEVEGTHAVADRYGYDLASTPLDSLMANDRMGYDMAAAMLEQAVGG